jgi:hypothetical protein
MEPDIWANSCAEQPRFPFTDKPGINVDLEDHSPLEYYELFCTPLVIARKTNWNAQKFLENMPNLNLKSKTHRWKAINTTEIMKLLAFFLLEGLHQKPDKKSYFCRRKILETPILWSCSARGGFTFFSSFFIFLTTKVMMRPLAVLKDCINSNS